MKMLIVMVAAVLAALFGAAGMFSAYTAGVWLGLRDTGWEAWFSAGLSLTYCLACLATAIVLARATLYAARRALS